MRSFGGTGELTAAELRAAVPRSIPRPSLLAAAVKASAQARKGLAALGIETHADLLEHFPHSHRDRREVRGLGSLGVGEEATVAVTVRDVKVRPLRDRRRKKVEAKVFDDTAPAVAVWWNQPWIARRLAPGAAVLLHGRRKARNEFWVDEYEPLGQGAAPVHTVGLVPVHPATHALSAGALRQLVWDDYRLIRHVVEPLPAALRVAEALCDRPAAVAAAHFPDGPDDAAGARRRLAFEELFLLQLAVAGRRRARREGRAAAPLAATGAVVDPWRERLPFQLTGDQARACAEIDAELARERPMQRLLMGEVGSGKTVVAVYAMLRAREAGFQAVLMAPTETLAEQHAVTLGRLLGGELTPFALLTGATPAPRRREALDRLASGELGLVVGTHALIEDTVELAALAVCVVDEQHRFGVRQRAALDAKAP
ncbi:MAG: DEAD/DEAH box helicase, partial [Solirubrobacterales bacterium]|nr:DEAD/DEAH box helicase [Solirubrobacterales bacterium]